MGAEEILKILSKGEQLTSIEIVERSENSKTAVRNTLRRLMKDISEDIHFRFLTTAEKDERYHTHIGSRIRIYWLNK